MNEDAKYRMSKKRLEELRAELEHMQTVGEKEISEQIKEARSFGDLSENSEYDEAKNAQGKLYSKIAEYKDLIENAIIIPESTETSAVVAMGSKVTVLEDGEEDAEVYEIVGSQEANPMAGRISEESLLGRALMGHSTGDRVEYEAPSGKMVFLIVKIGD